MRVKLLLTLFLLTLFISSTQNIHAQDLSNDPWWQVSVGNIYSKNLLENIVPTSCEDVMPLCNPNVITQNSNKDEKSAGVIMSGESISVNGFYTEYDTVTQPNVEFTHHDNIIKDDFEHLSRKIDRTNTQDISTLVTSLFFLEPGTEYGDAEVYYSAEDTVFDFSEIQTINSGEKYVFFIDGNIVFRGDEDERLINVLEGGYIAFISSRNIIFENSVGNPFSFMTPGSTSPNIAGVFIASEEIIIEDDNDTFSPDNMFVGEGTFVGWNGIQLNRMFDNSGSFVDRALNSEHPTEVFHFRPDFVKNTPQLFKKPTTIWQEVN